MIRSTLRTAALLALAVTASGCYHAVVDTGRAPSTTTIEKPWAHSFLAGLVPPDVVETASRCPDGVARVETKHSFLNSVANILTWGIYSPMSIEVTCAAGEAEAAPRSSGE